MSIVDSCGPSPNSQIQPRLRRCKICTLPPPCKHQTIRVARSNLIDELSLYPINPNAEICPSYFKTGCCESMHKRNHCIYQHPPITSPLVVLHTDHINMKGNRQSVTPDLFPTILHDPHFPCNLCKLKLPCTTHHHFSKYDIATFTKRGTHTEQLERCPLCTLPMPCTHFTTHQELENARATEANHDKRYPIDNTNSNCIHWVQTGSCVMHDTLGICLFWHPKSYANKRVNLDPLQLETRILSVAELANYDRDHHDVHGHDGLPGVHRSSGGSMKVRKTKLALEIQRQDSINIEEVRKRSWFPLDKNTGKPNKMQWKFPSPPACKLPLNEKIKEVWSLKKLLNKGSGNLKKETDLERDVRLNKLKTENLRMFRLRKEMIHKLWRLSDV